MTISNLRRRISLMLTQATPWAVAAIAIAVADFLSPVGFGFCVLHVALLITAWQRIARGRIPMLTGLLLAAVLMPWAVRLLVAAPLFVAGAIAPSTEVATVPLSETVVPPVPLSRLEPTRIWVILTLLTAGWFHADLQHRRRRRILMRRELQRKVRRRATQIRRINEALRREVARRQATQQLLTRTETHLQSLAQRMQLQVIRKDTDGVITYANEAFCRGVGKTIDEVIGSTDSDLYPTKTAENYRADDARVMATGIPVDHVESHPLSDGKTGWVQVFKAPEYDQNQNCVGIQMVFWDVTDAYRRTAELRRSEARKHALFDAAREAVMLVDEQGRIVEANPAAQTLLGTGTGSLAGCLLKTIATPESAATLSSDELNIAGKLARTQPPLPASLSQTERATMNWQDLPESERREMVVRRYDGVTFPAEISVHPIPLENSQGLAVFIRDVTLRHQAIRALKEAKFAAEEASRTKSEFMAGVSHEIRTPLGGITGSAELLSRMDLPDRAKQYVEMIRQSGELLSGVITDILDFASIEAGRLQMDPAPTDLHACVGEAYRCLATRAAGKDIEMILSIEPKVPRWVMVDAKRLRQIVNNLAGNAIKFTPSGYVHLKLRMQPIISASDRLGAQGINRALSNEDEIVLEMIDTGIGIPKDRQTKIFEPFEQGDSGTTKRYGGTGLGLSISQKLIKQMGGRIDVSSRPRHGSVFRCYLTLPRTDEDGQASHTKPSTALQKRINHPYGRSVAIDIAHPIQRKAIADCLIADGFIVDDQSLVRIVDRTMGPNKWTPMRFARTRQPESNQIRAIRLARVDEVLSEVPLLHHRVLLKPVLPDALIQALEQVILGTLSSSVDTTWKSEFVSAQDGDLPGDGQHSRSRLLVVDDSDVNRTVIHDFLAHAGYQVDLVDSGAKAILATQNTRYDCVLMDLQMPELDGVETMQQILSKYEELHLQPPPFIALTAHATDEHQTRCLDAGMRSFLTKPIDPVKLIDTVAKTILKPHTLPTTQPRPNDEKGTDSAQTDWQTQMLKSVGGDSETMVALAEAFVIEVPELCDSLENACKNAALREVKRSAHTLKSCLKYVAPPVDWQVLLEIENAAQAENLDSAIELLPHAIEISVKWTNQINHWLSKNQVQDK